MYKTFSTIAHLRNRAAEFHVKIPSKYRLKADLQRFVGALVVQRWWRKACRRQKRKMIYNDIDPFTLESIQEEPVVFTQFESELVAWKFRPDTLHKYFFETGNFSNPFTRSTFNYIELKRLYKQLCRQYPDRQWFPIHIQQRDFNIRRRAEEQRRQTVQLLTTEAYAILEHLWRPLGSPSPFQFRTILDQSFVLCNEQIPGFVRHINDIQRLDNDAAYNIVRSVILALRGVCMNPLLGPLYPIDQMHCATLSNQLLSQHFQHLNI